MKKSIILLGFIAISFSYRTWATGKVPKLEREQLVTKPILLQLINPVDSSKHPILGIAHRMNVSLEDFPLEVRSAILNADTLISELPLSVEDDSGRSVVNLRPNSNLASPVLSYYQKQANDDDLPTKLGDKHWQALQGIFKDRRKNPFIKAMSIGLKHQEAQTVISTIQAIARQEAYADDPNLAYLTLDAQIANTGLGAGKNLVGLETPAELDQNIRRYRATTIEHLQNLDPKGDMLVGILKNLIDNGGINHMRDTLLKVRANYLKGNVLKALEQLHPFILDPYFDEIVLDQRNLDWIEGGKIQELCWADNKCFIFVGFAHLFKAKQPLIKLLREQGFEVNAIEPAALVQDDHTQREALEIAD